MNTNDSLALCQRYFEAWRRHDAAAILATLAPDGHYEDPGTGGPIRGDALAAYAAALWSAFPDLDFELGEVHRVGERGVHAAWVMTGHNTGSFHGLPPTGRAVRLPGFDVIEAGADGIRHVRGYFDTAALPRQLGLQVVVQPDSIGPFNFGTSTRVWRDQPSLPAVLVATELVARDDEMVERIRADSRQTLIEQLGNPAFLGVTATATGRRMVTVSGWVSHEAMRSAMASGTHARAMQAFFKEGIAEAGGTSVYAAQRSGPNWRLCGQCGAMARLDGVAGVCRCGNALTSLV